MNPDSSQVAAWVFLASPLIFAISVWRGAVGSLFIFGIILMYVGAATVVFLPVFGLVISIGLFGVGVIMVAIGGALNEVLTALDKQPERIAGAIDGALSARAAGRERQAPNLRHRD